MILSESHVLEALARVVVEDAEAAARRLEDRALNQGRREVEEAEQRIADLARAARDLGRTRGRAAEAAEVRAGETEIEGVEARAFDALFERFLRHLTMALKSLPDSPRYAGALGAWAGHATSAIDGPVEVFCAKRDRAAVYEALLAAGATDFHVRIDHRVHVGFVVRTLDGHTRYDCRPQALVEQHTSALRALLEASVPPAPKGLAPAPMAPGP